MVAPTLHFGPFSLDGSEDGLWRGSERCKLTAKSVAVLRYLLAHPGHLVRKTALFEAVWPDVVVSDWALTTCIREIRYVLGDVAKTPRYIATVHRQGYRFIAPVRAADGRMPGPVPEDLPQSPRSASAGPEAPRSSPPAAALEEEHKMVTILCGALAEAPALAARLDPEQLYRLLQTVVGLAQEVLRRYAGTLTLATSESFTAVFGVPVTQEDHARRAVLAALELRQRLHDSPVLRAQLSEGELALGMGLHSGLVVVGELGQDPQRFATAVGAPLHIATRLQQQAAPGTILLSAATYQLVHADVRAAPYGTLTPDGPSAPASLYAVQGILRRHAGVAGRGPRSQSPFVGRERELAVLHDHLAAAVGGRGQVIGVVGEPGMGKSRLLTEFCRGVAGRQVTVYEGRCLSYGQATPYLPVRDVARQVCGLIDGDETTAHTAAVQQRLQASGMTAEDDIALLHQLLDLPGAPDCLAPRSPEAQQARTFELLRHLVLDAARRQPLVLVVENLHWVDPTSDAWLASLVDALGGAAVLLLGTYRPGYQPSWRAHSAVTQVALSPLRAQDSRRVVQAVLGAVPVPEGRLKAIITQAGGNPFFLEELAWHAVEQGGRDTVGPVPETVHAVLAARMDRLPSEAKHLLQTAAVIGMHTTLPLLQAVTELPDSALHAELTHLQAVELLYETRVVPELAYTFKHALIHDVAYQSLLKSTRQQIHKRTAQVLVEQFPDTVAIQPELLAHHYTEAGLTDQAIPYWQLAGQHASDRSASLEAVSHFTTGIELLKPLPQTPERAQQAISLYIALGATLQIAKGLAAPEVEHAYTEARALCQQLGEAPQLAPALFGLWRFYFARPQLHAARELGEALLRLAQHAHDPTLAVVAHYALGVAWLRLGTLPAARQHLEEGIARYTPTQHRAPMFRMGQDPGVACRVHAALTFWCLGYPDQALAHMHDALALAHELSHPYSLAFARCFAAFVSELRRDVPAVHQHAEAAVALSTEHGFPLWAAMGTTFRGWALAMRGQGTEGMAQVRHGIAAMRATGAALFVPYFVALRAEVRSHWGHTEDDLQALVEVHALVEQQDERWWEAEICRLRGVLLLRQTGTPRAAGEAETWLHQAADVARRQQAKSLGTTRCHEPEPLMAARGQTGPGSSYAVRGLRLVHRGFRHC